MLWNFELILYVIYYIACPWENWSCWCSMDCSPRYSITRGSGKKKLFCLRL